MLCKLSNILLLKWINRSNFILFVHARHSILIRSRNNSNRGWQNDTFKKNIYRIIEEDLNFICISLRFVVYVNSLVLKRNYIYYSYRCRQRRRARTKILPFLLLYMYVYFVCYLDKHKLKKQINRVCLYSTESERELCRKLMILMKKKCRMVKDCTRT